jgi:hypothetical protein
MHNFILITCLSVQEGFRIPTGWRDFCFDHCIETGVGPTQPPVLNISGADFPDINWPEHEADHLSPPVATVMNKWSCTSIATLLKRGTHLPFTYIDLLAFIYVFSG